MEYIPFFDDEYIDKIYRNEKVGKLSILKYFFRRLFAVIKKIGTKDLLFIEYELFPYFPPFFEFVLKISGVKYILDFDDAIFHSYDKSKSKIVGIALSNKIPTIAKYASHIITGSPYLTSYLGNFNSSVTEIPTSVNYTYYQSVKESLVGNKIKVGWLGSNSTSVNLLPLIDVFSYFNVHYPNLIFSFCGINPTLKDQLGGSNVEIIEWTKSNEIRFLNEINIGIMPLEDNLFNRGKCGFKLIQYMAMGKPTISTPLEANVKINHNNLNLFATSSKEWTDSLIKMVENLDAYQKIGNDNIELVRKYYSIEENSKNYISLFNSLL